MLHSYPWYIADWRSSESVMAMTLEQRGLYRELLDHCWECGSIPNSEVVLQKIAQVTAKEFNRCWPVVREQFREIDGRLHHTKVDEKREDLQVWHDNRREAGRKGAQKRWGSSAIAEPLAKNSYPDSHPLPLPLPLPLQETTTCPTGVGPVSDFALSPNPPNGISVLHSRQREWFDQWWAIYWRKVSRKPAEKAFLAKVKTLSRFEEVMRATRKQTAAMMAREPDHRPHGATWLNAERWQDESSAPAIPVKSEEAKPNPIFKFEDYGIPNS